MGDWKITVKNQTGNNGTTGKSVDVMLFQCVPDPLVTDSYSSAWKIGDVQYPGSLGPIVLPVKVQFYVLDKTEDGTPRETGPFDIEFGQIIDVTQSTAIDAPSARADGKAQPDGEIKVTNKRGNVKPLEMALYKNGRKIVSFKDVLPGDAVYLSVKPVIYIAQVDRNHMTEGDDFKAIVQSVNATQFELFPDVLRVNIGITQKPTGELKFVKL